MSTCIDNNILFNIVRKSPDVATAVSLMRAVGGHEMFHGAKSFNIVRTIREESMKNTLCDVMFIINNPFNENNIIERIRYAFHKADIARFPKTYALAAMGKGHQFMLLSPSNAQFLQGIMFLQQLVDDGEISILDDVRVSMPVNMMLDESDDVVVHVIVLAGIIRVRVNKIEHRSFYIGFDHIVKKMSGVVM